MQGGGAIPKRCDLPHGHFFSPNFSSPISLSSPTPSSAWSDTSLYRRPTFADISPRTNIRREIFGYAKLYRKSKRPLATRAALSRGESIFFEEAYDLSLSLSDREPSPPSAPPVDYSHLAIIAKSAETQRRNTKCRGESMNGACENVHAKCSLHNPPYEGSSYANGDFFIQRLQRVARVECCARIA